MNGNTEYADGDINSADELPEVEEKAVILQNSPLNDIKESQFDKITEDNGFSKAVDKANLDVLYEAKQNDKKFIEDVREELKKATLKIAEGEKEKAIYKKQCVEYHQELLDTQQKLNKQVQNKNVWEDKEKSRLFHYNGVKPIMEFVGIKSPMQLLVLYLLVVVLMPFFLLSKFCKGTIGVLIAGASDGDRPTAVKGFLWTVLGAFGLIALGTTVIILLNWLTIIQLNI